MYFVSFFMPRFGKNELATIGDKIVGTLSAKGATSEKMTIHTPHPPLHLKLGC